MSLRLHTNSWGNHDMIAELLGFSMNVFNYNFILCDLPWVLIKTRPDSLTTCSAAGEDVIHRLIKFHMPKKKHEVLKNFFRDIWGNSSNFLVMRNRFHAYFSNASITWPSYCYFPLLIEQSFYLKWTVKVV